MTNIDIEILKANDNIGQLLDHYLYEQVNKKLYDIARTVIDCRLFQQAPGSINRHHVYAGGLLVHTAEVAGYCSRVYPEHSVENAELILAAIIHDYMKISDYVRSDTGWVKAKYFHEIRHVAGSYAHWMKLAEKYSIDPETTQDIGHYILAHHGRKEWGSPVEPQNERALVLHSADMWSALYGPGAWLVESKVKESKESTYPCIRCGNLRTKIEGGTTFTICDNCWNMNATTMFPNIRQQT